ncbi:hypothetical protein EMCRGX_G004988 [Ephydatia muelleri]
MAPTDVTWTAKCETAFQELKRLLCYTPVLASPDFEKPFILQTDASNSEYGVGAVLSQRDALGCDHPIAYFSRKLLPREVRYSTVEKECLAIKLGMETFRVYLLGRKFIVETDHRSLVWLNKLKESNSRLTRWSLALQPFNYSWQQWRPICDAAAVQPLGTTLPLQDGMPLTANVLPLDYHTPDSFDAAKFNTHSLRIGAASTAARAGLPSDTIQKLVRWRSSAYETYTRHPPDSPIRHQNHGCCPVTYTHFLVSDLGSLVQAMGAMRVVVGALVLLLLLLAVGAALLLVAVRAALLLVAVGAALLLLLLLVVAVRAALLLVAVRAALLLVAMGAALLLLAANGRGAALHLTESIETKCKDLVFTFFVLSKQSALFGR